MTEENTTETFDPDLEYFIITILKVKKDDIRQALNNGGIFSWEDFPLTNPDDMKYLSYKDGNENRELPLLTQKRFKYAIFYYKWLIQDNDPKAEFPRLLTNSRNWSRISVDNSAASLLPGLWVGPMFSPCSDLLE
jgi:hypothetical protein